MIVIAWAAVVLGLIDMGALFSTEVGPASLLLAAAFAVLFLIACWGFGWLSFDPEHVAGVPESVDHRRMHRPVSRWFADIDESHPNALSHRDLMDGVGDRRAPSPATPAGGAVTPSAQTFPSVVAPPAGSHP